MTQSPDGYRKEKQATICPTPVAKKGQQKARLCTQDEKPNRIKILRQIVLILKELSVQLRDKSFNIKMLLIPLFRNNILRGASNSCY